VCIQMIGIGSLVRARYLDFVGMYGIYEMLNAISRSFWVDSMTQITNVVLHTDFVDHCLGQGNYCFLEAQEDFSQLSWVRL